ncbi:MAG: primosomal protein N' [Firmicutes bacterium]|nr:primosomal protein N' [Bacillota bacterium]
MNCEVLVELKSKSIDKTFTYSIPERFTESVKIGVRVLVPFGRQKLEGFVLKINEEKTCDYDLKEIIDVIDLEPVLNSELLNLGKYLSKKTMCNLITAYQAMLPAAYKAKKGKVVSKKFSTYLIVNNSDYSNIRSNKQLEVLNLVESKEKVLKSEANNISEYSVKVLLEKGYLREVKEETYRLKRKDNELEPPKQLTSEQQLVVDTVRKNLNMFKPFLLHGVTGSGKTEVYMHIIAEVLSKGKEALVLVPEISLTPQLVSQFENRFGSKIAILHSRLSDGEKFDEWRKIIRKEVSIVIGARSAVFAPLTNLGVIIIDEEHTPSYKQENNPHYNAIDVALFRAKYYQTPVVLGSATPSLESYTRAKTGVYELLELKSRISSNLPEVKLIDMKTEIRKGYRVLSEELISSLDECIKKDEQAVILLNRRGFSTILTCNSCGYTSKCPNCDIPLTFHKHSNTMRCHYCGYGSGKLHVCPSCGSKEISYFGMGTEKLEEWIKENVSSSKVIRMDIDTTTHKGSHEKIISAFKNKEYNILIGTQMIAKGLDFPDVTLVGVINGDASLNIPDFRSAERTFQLLNQVAGRAGRREKSGKVIIQGFNMDHYSIRYAACHDYQSFYLEEMNIRKALKYPPYFNLCQIKIVGKDYSIVSDEANKIGIYLKNNNNNFTVLGPSNSNVPKINNNYYMNIILKYKNTELVIPLLEFIKVKYRDNRSVNIDIYINPNQI